MIFSARAEHGVQAICFKTDGSTSFRAILPEYNPESYVAFAVAAYMYFNAPHGMKRISYIGGVAMPADEALAKLKAGSG
jgi:hypothetical protein